MKNTSHHCLWYGCGSQHLRSYIVKGKEMKNQAVFYCAVHAQAARDAGLTVMSSDNLQSHYEDMGSLQEAASGII